MTTVSNLKQQVLVTIAGSAALVLMLVITTAVSPLLADEGNERWLEIKGLLFGDREVRDGASLLALETPYRAMDAAVVPVEIKTLVTQTPQTYIKKLYLVIDNNPSPVAAVFHFPGKKDWQSLSTRVRVNAYTDVRVIGETNDGAIYMVSNFVKASGGCSAPPTKDPVAAAANLGRIKFKLPEAPADGSQILAQLLIKHPNNSGLQFDQISRNFIPADYVRRIEVSYNGEPVFSVDSDISISEDPSIRFGFEPEAGGELKVSVKDSTGRTFAESFGVGKGESG
ncbi:MAG: quinoprotein dehydrogenase-associated SoxYZ-like carrier [Gammaproteobacteria bacterium]|nr:quinoprotein dehydrogenase-associated SoxYZ-like carrier [Gammaproteobacteria bacterium]